MILVAKSAIGNVAVNLPCVGVVRAIVDCARKFVSERLRLNASVPVSPVRSTYALATLSVTVPLMTIPEYALCETLILLFA